MEMNQFRMMNKNLNMKMMKNNNLRATLEL